MNNADLGERLRGIQSEDLGKAIRDTGGRDQDILALTSLNTGQYRHPVSDGVPVNHIRNTSLAVFAQSYNYIERFVDHFAVLLQS